MTKIQVLASVFLLCALSWRPIYAPAMHWTDMHGEDFFLTYFLTLFVQVTKKSTLLQSAAAWNPKFRARKSHNQATKNPRSLHHVGFQEAFCECKGALTGFRKIRKTVQATKTTQHILALGEPRKAPSSWCFVSAIGQSYTEVFRKILIFCPTQPDPIPTCS